MSQTHQLDVNIEQAELINKAVRAFKVEIPLDAVDGTQTSASYRDLIGKLKTIMESENTPAVEPEVTPEAEPAELTASEAVAAEVAPQ